MPPAERRSLWQRLGAAEGRFVQGAQECVALTDLAARSGLDRPRAEFHGRCVLLAAARQLTAALALIELDGVARRLVLCPPDIAPEHYPAIAAAAGAEMVVVDDATHDAARELALPVATSRARLAPASGEPGGTAETEWVLLTSGTTGLPKLVLHSTATLTGAITGDGRLGGAAVWSTFYDIRRYGGLQIFLRAMLDGASLVLSDAAEPVADFLARAGAAGVTHISGTPSHWRRALMSPALPRLAPGYVRLSGEIADQAVLDHLRAAFPRADIAHAFASTEAGVAFAVGDGQAGFPAALVGRAGGEVEIVLRDGALAIRSGRTALAYLEAGGRAVPVAGPDGFVDTGDMVERVGDRFLFAGRKGGVINVGGAKVHPEQVEAVINRHPAVRMSRVRGRRSPITGAIVEAEIVLGAGAEADDPERLRGEILAFCREALPAHKVPASLRFRAALDVAASGKLARS